MIVKFNSRGAGAGSGPVNYLLGKERDREQAKTLRGDPERVKNLIDTCDFSRTYTSGVLSFQETNGSELQRQITPENSPEPLSDDLTDSGKEIP